MGAGRVSFVRRAGMGVGFFTNFLGIFLVGVAVALVLFAPPVAVAVGVAVGETFPLLLPSVGVAVGEPVLGVRVAVGELVPGVSVAVVLGVAVGVVPAASTVDVEIRRLTPPPVITAATSNPVPIHRDLVSI
jgi:hypothetical protein